MKNSLLYTLSVLLMIVPSISFAAAYDAPRFIQRPVPIKWINDTDQILTVNIISSNKVYESEKSSVPILWPILEAHSRHDDTTIELFGPYQVVIKKGLSRQRFVFEIQIIDEPTDILIIENPRGSKNIEVWYRSYQPIKMFQALAVMEATHQRIGAEAPVLGGEIGTSGRYDIYKQIAEHLLPKWHKAAFTGIM